MYLSYSKWVIRNKTIVSVIITLISLAFAYILLGLKVNSSPYFMPQHHESRIHELDIKALFSNSGEQILVVLNPDSGSPTDPDTIKHVKSLTRQFEQISLKDRIDNALLAKLNISSADEAKNPEEFLQELSTKNQSPDPEFKSALTELRYLIKPIIKVRSYASIENMTSHDDELDLHPLLPKQAPLSKEDRARFESEIRDNPLFKGLLLSDDGELTSIQIEMSIPKEDNPAVGDLYEQIKTIIEESDYPGEIYLAGNPVVEAEMARSMEQDNLVFFPLVLGVIASILFIGFRRFSGIAVPLTIAGITTLWTLGLMVAVGKEQNIVTTSLPVFLLTIAVADAIHFYSHFMNLKGDKVSLLDRLEHTFSQLTRPLVLTSVTTLAGFIALAWTDIIFIQEFGLLLVVGVLIALILTMLLAPVLISYAKPEDNSQAPALTLKIENIITHGVMKILAHPKTALTALLIMSIASLASIQQLEFDQENMNNFDADTVLRQHNDAIMTHYDGTNPVDIWIDTGEQGGLYNPETIRQIEAIEDYLNKREDIGYVLSPVGFLKRMYHLLTEEGHILPEDLSSGLIAQEILLYENESSQDIKHVIDDMHRHARIIVLGNSDAASFWGPVIQDIEAMAPQGTRLEVSGYGKVMYSNIQEVIKTNISSTIIAVALIALIMITLFKSVTLGVIGVLPLVLTVLMNYALMAFMDVAVDVSTTIIASIAFGIGIDYSIHLLSHIERQFKNSDKADLQSLIQNTVRTVGIPILINSLTLAGGFLVLLASKFLTLQLLGLFISITMLISAVNALVIVPLLYFVWRRQSC